jgi:hypothetical protein
MPAMFLSFFSPSPTTLATLSNDATSLLYIT